MEKDLLYKIISKVFNVSETEITDSSSPETIFSWDSMGHLMLISALEEALDIKIGMNKILEIKNVEDIKRVLRRKGIEI